MMKRAQLDQVAREFLHRQPFRPFAIEFEDGQRLVIGDAAGSFLLAHPAAPGERVNTCNPAPGQNYIGQKASSETGKAILAATGATRLRWVAPRTVVTMEFAYGRVTVSYDDDFAIRQVSCG